MEAALHAAGAVCQAVDDCFTGKIDRAFCAVRPPGHHALAGEAMGFCLFNNAAIGAMYAMSKYGAERIALVDIDVHHGNGTEAFAREHEGIFFISSHQWPLWPGSGRGDDNIEGRILNIPLPPGSGPREFRRAYKEQVFPALEEYGPELILISAGFDAHRDDPLAGLNLMDEDYGWITGNICDIAERHCGGRVISTLEGGYNLDALKRSVAAHLRALMSADNFYF
jgi:acetoin utilization deacetylase AcuC-like enzyme